MERNIKEEDNAPIQQAEDEEAAKAGTPKASYDKELMNSTARSGFTDARTSSLHNYKQLSSGVSPFAKNAQNDMMKAIVHKKSAEDQQTIIKARIIKLLKEEEKANKRIKDLDRRQAFVANMHKLKQDKFAMLRKRREDVAMTEQMNRVKFTQMRQT